MLLLLLLLIPLVGIFIISTGSSIVGPYLENEARAVALATLVVNLIVSLVIFILFDFSQNQFQFVQEYHKVSFCDLYLGVDGLSIYFVLLTTIIMPIALLSNWSSIISNQMSYAIIILLLETLLLAVFLVLDIFLFYVFFESTLIPLFLLIGLFGSDNKVRASLYLFLYTLFGSLFLLLAILTMSSLMGTTDFDALFKANFNHSTQMYLFYGIFLAFAVKTPVIFLNTWLLKAHVESPLSGSIILAAIVLKLSLYGIFRLILPILPKASLDFTYVVYAICVITILYASLSTLRTIDIKELIAYSSVAHAAVYLMAVFSNTTQGIEGGILLGIGHGFVSSGLFICAGGILYDRTHTRLITYYRGVAQIMPLFSLLFFVLCLGNSGTPLTLNFIGEFLSLSGVFERMPVLSALAASSIVFSAAYTFFMYNRIVFGGTLSAHLAVSLPDLSKREYTMLIALILPTVLFGIYPAPILDGLHYSVSTLIHAYNDQLGAEQLTMSLFLVGSSKGSAFLAEHKMTYGCPAKVEGKKTMKKIILDIGTILAITGKNIWEDKLPYPTPHIKVMKAGGITELLTSENLEPIITEINRLIPQVDGFIKGINDFVKVTEINVVVDVEGRIGVDILESVPGELAHKWATRVEITHSLIVDRVSTLFSLFKRAVEIEVKIVEVDPNYQVRIPELRANFNAVKSNYKFITL